jgi:hypothetical protein
MTYVVVITANSKNYLVLTEDNGKYVVKAWKSIDDVMDTYKGYTEKLTSDYAWQMSTTIAFIQALPHIIKMENDDAELLRPFIISMTPVGISGGAIGRGYVGLEVNEDILKLEVDNVFNLAMIKSGLK